jgi:hypothetical protein
MSRVAVVVALAAAVLAAGCSPSIGNPVRIRAGSSYRDRRFYLLPGACLAYTFGLTGTGAEAAAEDISRAIGLVGRDQLADQVRSYSRGLLQLDPERPR